MSLFEAVKGFAFGLCTFGQDVNIVSEFQEGFVVRALELVEALIFLAAHPIKFAAESLILSKSFLVFLALLGNICFQFQNLRF